MLKYEVNWEGRYLSKYLWQWIFNELSDEQLNIILTSINEHVEPAKQIRVPGLHPIDQLNIDQISYYRDRLESELLKPQPLKRVRTLFQSEEWLKSHFLEVGQYNKLRDMEMEALVDLFMEFSYSKVRTWLDIFISFLASSEARHLKQAEELFERLYLSGEIKRYKDAHTQQIIELSVRISMDQYETKLMEITRDKEALEEQLANYMIEQIESKSISRSQKKRIKKLNKQSRAQENKLKKLQSELISKEEMIQSLTTKLSSDHIDIISKQPLQRKRNLFVSKQVILLDKNITEILNSQYYNIQLLNPREIEQQIENSALQHCDEIWLLKFRIPFLRRSQLRHTYGDRVMEFDSYSSLKEYSSHKKGRDYVTS